LYPNSIPNLNLNSVHFTLDLDSDLDSHCFRRNKWHYISHRWNACLFVLKRMWLNSNFLREKKRDLDSLGEIIPDVIKVLFPLFSHYSWYIYPLVALIHFLTSSVTQTCDHIRQNPLQTCYVDTAGSMLACACASKSSEYTRTTPITLLMRHTIVL